MAGGKHSPRNLRSCSPSSSRSSSPVQLDASTQALLDLFLADKAAEEERFSRLEEEARLRQIQAAHDDAAAALGLAESEVLDLVEKPIMGVKEFREIFREDWQLSQFWYSEEYAYSLARSLHKLCGSISPEEPSSVKVGFLCCPTAYVAFQHTSQLPGQRPHPHARLFEYDQQFGVLNPAQYVFYDLDEPREFPKEYQGWFDIAVVDPPFLNEATNSKLHETLTQILAPSGKLIIQTSIQMEVQGILQKIYHSPPCGPLHRTGFEVDCGQLANDFASWGSWEEASEFGKIL